MLLGVNWAPPRPPFDGLSRRPKQPVLFLYVIYILCIIKIQTTTVCLGELDFLKRTDLGKIGHPPAFRVCEVFLHQLQEIPPHADRRCFANVLRDPLLQAAGVHAQRGFPRANVCGSKVNHHGTTGFIRMNPCFHIGFPFWG